MKENQSLPSWPMTVSQSRKKCRLQRHKGDWTPRARPANSGPKHQLDLPRQTPTMCPQTRRTCTAPPQSEPDQQRFPFVRHRKMRIQMIWMPSWQRQRCRRNHIHLATAEYSSRQRSMTTTISMPSWLRQMRGHKRVRRARGTRHQRQHKAVRRMMSLLMTRQQWPKWEDYGNLNLVYSDITTSDTNACCGLGVLGACGQG